MYKVSSVSSQINLGSCCVDDQDSSLRTSTLAQSEGCTDAVKRLRGAVKTDAKNDSGAVSVEFVIWLPLVLGLALLVFEASATFMNQANSWRTANHLARAVTTGRMQISEAETLGQTVVGHPVAITHNQGLLRVDITVPFSDIGIGMLSSWGDIRITLFQRVEPHVSL